MAASFTHADGIAMQGQVATLLQQMSALMDQNARITSEFDQFRAMATQEISNPRTTGGGGSSAGMSGLKLMDLKDFKPQMFSGQRDQEYKPWRKRFLTYTNMQCPGFRAALEWIENRNEPIDAMAIQQLAWAHSADAYPKLWDFLMLMTSEDFEAWRLIFKLLFRSSSR